MLGILLYMGPIWPIWGPIRPIWGPCGAPWAHMGPHGLHGPRPMGQGRWAGADGPQGPPRGGVFRGPRPMGPQGLHGPRGPPRGGVYKGPQGPPHPQGGGPGPWPIYLPLLFWICSKLIVFPGPGVGQNLFFFHGDSVPRSGVIFGAIQVSIMPIF